MAPRKNAKGRSRRGRRGGNSGVSAAAVQRTANPPAVITAPPQRLVKQYRVITGAQVLVNRASLLALVVSFNENAATSVVPEYTAVRVRKVSIWIGGGTGSAVSLTWLGYLGPDRVVERSWMSGIPSAIIEFAPRNSRASMWTRSDADATTLLENLFVINGNNNDGPAAAQYQVAVDLEVSRATNAQFGAAYLSGSQTVTFAGLTGGPTQSGRYDAALDNIGNGVLTKGAWSALPVGGTAISTAQPTTWTLVES